LQKEILISVEQDETRAAVLEDGILVEFHLERPLTQRVAGHIFKGRVENVLPGMQAAFVNIGLEKNAFLYVADAHPLNLDFDSEDDDLPEDLRRATIKDLLKVGQEVIVQVAKEPTGNKGARITRNLTVPGRFLVLMPGVDYVGVSRKIAKEEERERLKQLAHELRPRGMGVIVRTVAEGRSREDLARDMRFLQRLWADIQQRAKEGRAPKVLYQDLSLSYRMVRDHFTTDVDSLVVDSPREYERIRELVGVFSPELVDRVQLFQHPHLTLFDARGINEEMEQALKKRVWLKSGGYIVIDQTEALTAIDVNTGRYVGTDNLQETIFKTNMEAAREIARQLRLRDIGGIIIIDFIDMEKPHHRHQVVRELDRALERDRTRTTVLGLTQLGLVELTRKKGRRSLLDQLTRTCHYCDGRGYVLTEESVARRVRREIKRIMRNAESEAILVEVHPSVASLLIGPGGTNLRELERETGKNIFVRGAENCHVEEMIVRSRGTREEVEERALPVKTGQVLELTVEEPHVSNVWDGIARVEGYVIDIEGAGNKVGEKVKVEITRAFRTYAKAKMV